MLYMIVEHFRTPGALEIYRRARDKGRMIPDGLGYVTSWVDLDFKTCWQVMKTDNRTLIDEWISHWQDLVDFEVIPVQTSAEAMSIIAPTL